MHVCLHVVCVCAPECVLCVPIYEGNHEGQKKISDPLELERQMALNHLM